MSDVLISAVKIVPGNPIRLEKIPQARFYAAGLARTYARRLALANPRVVFELKVGRATYLIKASRLKKKIKVLTSSDLRKLAA